MPCDDCYHREVCAVRKAFDNPIKKLAATALSSDDDKQMLDDQVVLVGRELSEIIGKLCGVVR